MWFVAVVSAGPVHMIIEVLRDGVLGVGSIMRLIGRELACSLSEIGQALGSTIQAAAIGTSRQLRAFSLNFLFRIGLLIGLLWLIVFLVLICVDVWRQNL